MATVRNGASITEQQDEFNDDEINNHQRIIDQDDEIKDLKYQIQLLMDRNDLLIRSMNFGADVATKLASTANEVTPIDGANLNHPVYDNAPGNTAPGNTAPRDNAPRNIPRAPPSLNPSDSDHSSRSSRAAKQLGLAKELIKLIPQYDGTSSADKLFEFIDNFEDFATDSDLSHAELLKVATAKLTGNAKVWWRSHRRLMTHDSPNRIRTWNELKTKLIEIYAPPEYDYLIREKL